MEAAESIHSHRKAQVRNAWPHALSLKIFRHRETRFPSIQNCIEESQLQESIRRQQGPCDHGALHPGFRRDLGGRFTLLRLMALRSRPCREQTRCKMVLSVQRPRYKYVSCIDHAKWFQQGKMFHRTASYYRDYEDKKATQVIGDQYECTRLYVPAAIRKMAPDGTPGEWQNLPPDQRMECITRAHEIFVFCLSLSLNDTLRKEFDAVACVEISIPPNSMPDG
jgi:hypothetical protein